MHTSSRAGFSFLELSMVIVGIGLMVGGILVGTEMLRQAQARAVIAEVDKYAKAVQLFRDRYMALPGDMTTATTEWGAAHGTATNCKTTIGTGTQTCNGDGNGRITNQAAGQGATWFEQFRAWQHLANAGLIEGSFTGITSGAVADTQVYAVNNCPAAAIGGCYALLTVTRPEAQAAASLYFDLHYGTMLRLADASGAATGGVLTPAEAKSLDDKLDDGVPASGKVVPLRNPTTASCLTTDVAATAAYNVSDTQKRCSLQFLLGM